MFWTHRRCKAAMAEQDVVYANLAGEGYGHSLYQTPDLHKFDGDLRRDSGGTVPEHSGPVSRLSEDHRAVRSRLHDRAAGMAEGQGRADYATTKNSEPFKNASNVILRKSAPALVVKLAMTPGVEIHSSLGVHKA
jgi:hypothetical protein